MMRPYFDSDAGIIRYEGVTSLATCPSGNLAFQLVISAPLMVYVLPITQWQDAMQAMFCCQPVHAISGPAPQQLVGLPRMHPFAGPGP
jgi:hypothetical protein